MTFQEQYDHCKAKGWLEFFKAAATEEIPLELLLGVASRETKIQNVIGDHGHGHGIMQIDDRWHADFLHKHANGLDPESNIHYAAMLLASNFRAAHGDLVITIAAYNAGMGQVAKAIKAGKSADAPTTGGDYSTDVIARSLVFKSIIEKDSK